MTLTRTFDQFSGHGRNPACESACSSIWRAKQARFRLDQGGDFGEPRRMCGAWLTEG
jgi:hypothetical protein